MPFFFEQNMQDVWSLPLAYLLVCQSAIFIDSKRDGTEPNATVAYLSSLEGSREERAFELAKNEYLAWLEHKADRYTTVYGYMD